MLDLQKIEAAINMISAEKKIPKEKLIGIIEAAIQTAYKKDYGNREEKVNAHLNLKEGTIEVSVEKTVVKEVEDKYTQISFEELGDDADGFEEGDVIELDVTDEIMKDGGESFGRIASQAARQVIIQKIGDSEKEKIYELFKDKEGEVVNMKVDIVEGGKIIFDYNGNQVVLPKSEQVSRDNYTAGSRFFIYVAEVVGAEEGGVPRVVLSRKRPEMIPAIFAQFVPEIADGIINIDNVVRQPGVKTKMLVSSAYEEIDPVGTLIGQKGIRVKGVMEELSGEKIDIVPNAGSVEDIIKKSLSPANVVKVEVDEENESSKVYIPFGERARAVGKNGLNVNLASRLIGYKISIEELPEEESKEEVSEVEA